MRAAGGAIHAVDEVVAKKAANAFVATRPPGHHAETARPMGFCFFDNAAIAARHAQNKHGIAPRGDRRFRRPSRQRLAGDFLVRQDRDVLLDASDAAVSRHRRRRRKRRLQYRRQCAVASRRRAEKFRDAFDSRILPRLAEFAPELVIISAGFDAHYRDPLANINLDEADFAWATQKIMEVADRHAGGRVVSLLEGGYDLQALGNSVAAHVNALMQG